MTKKDKKRNFQIPALNGYQLIKLFVKDNWHYARKAKHGRSLWKLFRDRKRVIIIPEDRKPLDQGTLAAILGPKQSKIGKAGLRKLLEKYKI